MSDAHIHNKYNYTINNNIILDNDKFVFISIERLQHLELLERQLPEMIDAAIKEQKNKKLKLLHQKDKENPDAVNIRVKRYNETHKDEINFKRRAKRIIKKEEEEAIRVLLIPDQNCKAQNKKVDAVQIKDKLTVRFNN